MQKYKKECVIAPLFKLLEACFDLCVPLVVAAIIDQGIKSGDVGYVWRTFGLLILLGVVGLSSYVAAGLQDITSGLLIQYNTVQVDGADVYDFGPVSWFWLAAALISFILPVLNWKKMKNNQ